jgi:hypothetical protein
MVAPTEKKEPHPVHLDARQLVTSCSIVGRFECYFTGAAVVSAGCTAEVQ